MVGDLKSMQKDRTRALSPEFVQDLGKGGILGAVTDMVRNDKSLCLELRGKYINVYYRGGNLMKINSSRSPNTYSVEFNKNYFRGTIAPDLPDSKINGKDNVEHWVEITPILKRGMDLYSRRREEREFQQIILRDNNFGSSARQTDYYICDIEYANKFGQCDMVAVHWPSVSATRKIGNDRRLAFIEVKYGDNSLRAKSGICEHIKHVDGFASDYGNLDRIKQEMVNVFNQKRKLNLITCDNNLVSFSNEKPLLLLALVNHDPDSKILRDVLRNLPESPNVDLRIATASFLGYGLYDQGIHSLDSAWGRFSEYISSKGP